jgi:quinol monooxygenase YgiN
VKSITKNDRTLEGNDGAGKFTVWVNLYPLESAISEFRGTIGVNKAGTDNKTLEPNAKQYTYGENVAAPDSFHFFEVYDDEAGFKVHAGAEHFLKVNNHLDNLCFPSENSHSFVYNTTCVRKHDDICFFFCSTQSVVCIINV